MHNPAIVAAAAAAAAAQTTANAAPSGADVATMFVLRGSRNLFNLAAATPGLVYTVDGTIINAAVQAGGASSYTGYTSWPSTWMASDYFPVEPKRERHHANAGTYFGSTAYGFAWFDVNKVFISSTEGVAASTAVAVPSNAVYCRVAFAIAGGSPSAAIDPTTVMIVNGSTLPASYAPFAGDPVVYGELATLNSEVATITTTVSGVFPLAGKKWMPFGDSITAILHGTYQQPAIALTGLTIPIQDAHGGRNTAQIFDNYSNDPVAGVGLNGVIPGQPLAIQLPESEPD